MKILEINILVYGTLAQIQLDLQKESSTILWQGSSSYFEQIMSFLVFIFYGQSNTEWSSQLLSAPATDSNQMRSPGGSISFIYKGDRYLLERISSAHSKRDTIKLLNESSGEDLSANCTSQPGWDLFSLGQDEFMFCLGIAPLPKPEKIQTMADQVQTLLEQELASLQDHNGERGKSNSLDDRITQINAQIEITQSTDKNQAELIENIYLHKLNIQDHESKIEEIKARIDQLELLEDKARYENLILLRQELDEAESEGERLARVAQEKNLPSALEMTSFEDMHEDWNHKARNMQELRTNQASAVEEVKMRLQICQSLKEELDYAEQREEESRQWLQNEDNNFHQLKQQHAETKRKDAGSNRIYILTALAAVAGIFLALADMALAGYVLLGIAFIITLLTAIYKIRRRRSGGAELTEAAKLLEKAQEHYTAVSREKSSAAWRLQEEIDSYHRARQREEDTIKELSKSETETNFIGYELVNSMSRYVRIHYPQEAARALRELRSRITDASPVQTKTAKILNRIADLKDGRTDEEIKQEYEYATEKLYGSVLDGDKSFNNLPSVTTSRYNPEALANAKGAHMRLQIELDHTRKSLITLTESLDKSFSLVNLADLYRKKNELEEQRNGLKDQLAALNIALEYLKESKNYRQKFYRQIKDRSATLSTQITEDREIELDPDLTGALVLRSVTRGSENMPLFVSSAVRNGEHFDLPSRLRKVINHLPQMIILSNESEEPPVKWSIF
ncbi:MAG TPA: hypothetical protein VFF56_02000 [Bacillota bacterium]|nr:hypothetical protein [Bacillota bacterium]